MNGHRTAAHGRGDARRTAAHTECTARDELRDFMADLEDLMAAVSDDADIARLHARLRQSIDGARARLAGSAENAEQRARDAARGAEACLREKPWQALGAAALIGVVLGSLVARR